MPPTDNLDKLSWTQGDKTGTCVATNARGLVASLRAGGANVFDGVHIDIKMGRMSCCAACVLLCDMRWHTWSRVGVRRVPRLPWGSVRRLLNVPPVTFTTPNVVWLWSGSGLPLVVPWCVPGWNLITAWSERGLSLL